MPVRSPEPPRVLVVDDELLICAVAMEALADSGFHSEGAGSAAEALAKLHDAPFDAAIVDIGLPDRPGDALVAEIRTRWSDLAIVIASGYDVAQLAHRFETDPRVRVVPKPYDNRALLEALATLGVAPTRTRQGG